MRVWDMRARSRLLFNDGGCASECSCFPSGRPPSCWCWLPQGNISVGTTLQLITQKMTTIWLYSNVFSPHEKNVSNRPEKESPQMQIHSSTSTTQRVFGGCKSFDETSPEANDLPLQSWWIVQLLVFCSFSILGFWQSERLPKDVTLT